VLELLAFGAGVLVASGAHLLLRARSGRRRRPAVPGEHLPPPAGHQAVLADGEHLLRCPCGWWCALPWPLTSRRLNRARADHYAAVEQERIARRLGIDGESVLDRIVAAQRADRRAPAEVLARPVPAVAHREVTHREVTHRELTTGWTQHPQRLRANGPVWEARRASAIARVEAGRVLPKYTGGEE
jgi:hypothetical protein